MPIEQKFIPNVRTTFVADDDREFDLPVVWGEWFDQLSAKGKEHLWQTGTLNRKQCRALWKYLERSDPVPRLLRIYVSSEDMMRVFPEIKKI